MNEERILLIEALQDSKSSLTVAWHHILTNPKNAQVSQSIRRKGDAVFIGENHDDKSHRENFTLYCKCIAFAPSGSQELGLAYANRSAFLLHIGEYIECIKDIQKAMSLIESNDTKVQLLCRQVQCMENLSIAGYERTLAEAQNFIDKIDCSNTRKEEFYDKLKSVTAVSVDQQISEDETIDLPVTNNVLENINIRYNKKYGRQLIAMKKYKPGDIIFVEKLFAKIVGPDNQYINCHHCMKACWSGIPCNGCNWAMFCSADCFEECWNDYHDNECSLVSFLNDMNMSWPVAHLSIKIILKFLKNAGSIFNLKTELACVDKISDICMRGFIRNEEFVTDSIQSIYSLESKKLCDAEKIKILEYTLNFLVGVVKYTNLMKNLNKSNIDSLMTEDSLFLGSLFIKITAVIMNNSFQLSPFLGIEDVARGISEDSRGIGLAPLASLINHNCNPNAKICFTNNGKAVVFAAHTIKKNSQIFISYCKEYYIASLEDRKTMLKSNFVCHCLACSEAWSPELSSLRVMQEIAIQLEDPDRTTFQAIEQKFLNSTDSERKLLLSGDTIFKSTDNYCNSLKEKVENLSKKVIVASKDTRKPSVILSLYLEALYASIANLYNGLKPQLFGKCKKSRK